MNRTPRVQITLKPETRAIFSRLAAAQARPEAAVIAEFLEETAPALKNVVHVVEKAKNIVQRVGERERDRFALAEQHLLQLAAEAQSKLHGASAVLCQLDLDLGKRQPARGVAKAPPRSRVPVGVSEADPQRTNRGVNIKRKAPATRSKP